jgi:hypothetical protein
MDIKRKCELAVDAVLSIATHDDAPIAEVHAALDALSAFIVKEKQAAVVRRDAFTKVAAEKIAAVFH